MTEVLYSAPRSTLSAVTDALRAEILRGVYKGGDRLRQDAIASQFKVSQSITREAFTQLAAEGLLVSEPRRGVFVPRLTADEAEEISALRSLVEPQALVWAWANMDDAVFERASRVLEEIDMEGDPTRLIELNNRFHMCLYEPSGKLKTLDLITSLRRNFERYLRFTWQSTEHISQSQDEHRALLALCRSGDKKGAERFLRQHIQATGKLLVSKLRQQHDAMNGE